MLQIGDSLEMWGYVLVAVELRILELKKLPSVTGRVSSLCIDQLEALEKFSTQLRREFADYEAQFNAKGRNDQ